MVNILHFLPTDGVQDRIDHDASDSDNATCDTQLGVTSDQVFAANNCNSGVLPVSVNNAETVHTKMATNDLVQVSSQGPLDVINATDIQMVGNQLTSISTIAPTLTNQLTEMVDVTNLFKLPDATSVENLPFVMDGPKIPFQ